jgi:hypothetical protein
MIFVAYKKLRYFLITNRLQKLFMSLKISEHLTWYPSHDAKDKVMMHSFNGETWKQFNRVYLQFSPYNNSLFFFSFFFFQFQPTISSCLGIGLHICFLICFLQSYLSLMDLVYFFWFQPSTLDLLEIVLHNFFFNKFIMFSWPKL